MNTHMAASGGQVTDGAAGGRRAPATAGHHRVLIVDDESAIRFGIRAFLEARGYEVDEAATCGAAEAAFRESRPDVVVLDHMLTDGTALDLLARLKHVDATVPLFVLTGHGSIDLAVRAVKEGAEHFLTKPVELPALLVMIERSLANRRDRLRDLARRSKDARDAIDPFRGTSQVIRDLAAQARKIAEADSPVLIRGETGTGKSLLAAWIHQNGPRAEEQLVDLNCAGLEREFLETELFGHEKGAFTGASSSKLGLLELAHRGTVFLDEIGDVDPRVQPKLLKVLEEKRFRRLGDVRDRRVDIRLIAATHQNLAALVKEKLFRSDLYFRISTLPLVVPALRERAEDIPALAAGILSTFAAQWGRGYIELAPDAESALQAYSWPGNVRELRNVLERALLLGGGEVLERADLHFDPSGSIRPPGAEAAVTLLGAERQHIERVLRDERGNVDRAAARLGVPRSSLYQKIKRHKIVVPRESST